MNGRFRSFSFVDRITRNDGRRVEGHYTVPPNATHFPPSLMAEAVGQLAAWSSMNLLDFALRPVAGLAAESLYWQTPQPGHTLTLSADIERCDAEAVAYSGRALIDGRPAVEIIDCVGPMLPLAQFDSAEAVRADYATLCNTGADANRFGGVPAARFLAVESTSNERLQAELIVPTQAEAPYFDDHFPRRAVYPGTLLLDALATLALQLARHCAALRSAAPLAVTRVSNVKIRSFTEPGTVLQLEVELIDVDARRARLKLAARADGKMVATARAEITPRPAT